MGADAGEDPVRQTDHGVLGRYEAPALGQQHDDGRLTQVGRLAGHVRAGEDDDLGAVRIEVEVVGDEHPGGQPALDEWVAAALDRELQARVDLWAAPGMLGCSDRKADQRVHHAHRLGAGPKRRR